MKQRWVTYSPEETKKVGAEIGSQLSGADVLYVYGDLGAGKTTCITGIIQHFLPGKRVLSPTFSLVRVYHPSHTGIKTINHLDLYRLQTVGDVYALGVREMMSDPDAITIIEWPERLGGYTSQNIVSLSCRVISDVSREIVKIRV